MELPFQFDPLGEAIAAALGGALGLGALSGLLAAPAAFGLAFRHAHLPGAFRAPLTLLLVVHATALAALAFVVMVLSPEPLEILLDPQRRDEFQLVLACVALNCLGALVWRSYLRRIREPEVPHVVPR